MLIITQRNSEIERKRNDFFFCFAHLSCSNCPFAINLPLAFMNTMICNAAISTITEKKNFRPIGKKFEKARVERNNSEKHSTYQRFSRKVKWNPFNATFPNYLIQHKT